MNNNKVGIIISQKLKEYGKMSNELKSLSFVSDDNQVISLIPYYFGVSEYQFLKNGIMNCLQKFDDKGTKELNLILFDIKNITEASQNLQRDYFYTVFDSLENYFDLKDSLNIEKIYVF